MNVNEEIISLKEVKMNKIALKKHRKVEFNKSLGAVFARIGLEREGITVRDNFCDPNHTYYRRRKWEATK